MLGFRFRPELHIFIAVRMIGPYGVGAIFNFVNDVYMWDDVLVLCSVGKSAKIVNYSLMDIVSFVPTCNNFREEIKCVKFMFINKHKRCTICVHKQI